MKNTLKNIFTPTRSELSEAQRIAIAGFAIFLAIDAVYTSLGLLRGAFVELNPVINIFGSTPPWGVLFVVVSHIVFFISIYGMVMLMSYKNKREGGKNIYTRFVLSMVCYIPCFMMGFGVWFVVCLNWFSGVLA